MYILRSVPGAGKSTLAEQLAGEMGQICESDVFLINDKGEYEWTEERVFIAHKRCQQLCKESLEAGISPIVISNTNTTTKDVRTYRDMGIAMGYKVFVMVIENWHNGQDSHNVKDEVKARMERRLRDSIRLRATADADINTFSK